MSNMAHKTTKNGSTKRTGDKHERGNRTNTNADKRTSKKGWDSSHGGSSKGAKRGRPK